MPDLIDQLAAYRPHIDAAIDEAHSDTRTIDAPGSQPTGQFLPASTEIERSIDHDTIESPVSSTVRRLLVAAAAAAVLIIGVSVVERDGSPENIAANTPVPAESATSSTSVPESTTVPTTTPVASPAETVKAYFAASNERDSQETLALLDPDATIYGHPRLETWTAHRPLADAAIRGDVRAGTVHEVTADDPSPGASNYEFVGTFHFALRRTDTQGTTCFPHASVHVSDGLIVNLIYGNPALCDENVASGLGNLSTGGRRDDPRVDLGRDPAMLRT
ncbi:MAG: hypothetical protein GY708_22085 [Actinomycetia bacterium]|nr:hypothetical protein [Actinomycetes bacterium]MCP4958032.1 hypothetical protein [Actinomycetes bacterium]